MKIVYIAGKYGSADPWDVSKNIHAASEAAAAVVLCGAMPFCPHRNTARFEHLQPPDFWQQGNGAILRHCDALYAFDEYFERSEGTRAEMQIAVDMKIPIFIHSVHIAQWVRGVVFPAWTQAELNRALS